MFKALSFALSNTFARGARPVTLAQGFHSSGGAIRGFEAFFDAEVTAAGVKTGRAWTVPDLRRKVILSIVCPPTGIKFIFYTDDL
jgi:hypothetical protein